MQHREHHHSFILFSLIMLFFAFGVFHNAYASDQLFSLKISMINEHRKLIAGKEVVIVIKIFNRQAQGRADVVLNYSILGPSGDVIISETETAAVETQTSIVRRFALPPTLPKGQYSMNVELSSLDKKNKARASQDFELIEVPKDLRDLVLYLIGIITVLNTFIIFSKGRKAVKEAKVSEIDLEKMGFIKKDVK